MRARLSIEELRRRKSLDVSQQIEVARDDIRREAVFWQTNPIRHAVREVFTARGIDIDRGIFVSVSDFDCEPECTVGTFVTSHGRFIEFCIELSDDGELVTDVSVFKDVTDEQDICGHKPGIGATRSFLILEVLRELTHVPLKDREDDDSSE